jgi:hypothetical protein
MPEELNGTAAGEPGTRGEYLPAEGIHLTPRSDTAATAAQVRTVVTSLTEGQLSLRFAPRQPRRTEASDTAS